MNFRMLCADSCQSPRAVCAVVICPAFQRRVDDTKKSSRVPQGRNEIY